MPGTLPGKFELNESGLALLLGELDHRMRNLLMMVEGIVRQTQSASVEDYRTKLIARIGGLREFCQLSGRYDGSVELAELLEQTVRPYSTNGARILAAGPHLDLERSLALPLHLVFHELATNAKKYGALSSPLGRVAVEWTIRPIPDGSRKLTILWTEQGGPELKGPRGRGFGSRLIETALSAFGVVRLDFNRTGLACLMLIELDRPEARK
jgi:two-component sensor histidine kinase